MKKKHESRKRLKERLGFREVDLQSAERKITTLTNQQALTVEERNKAQDERDMAQREVARLNGVMDRIGTLAKPTPVRSVPAAERLVRGSSDVSGSMNGPWAGAAAIYAGPVQRLEWSVYTPVVDNYTVVQAKQLWPQRVYLDCSGSSISVEQIREAIWAMGEHFIPGPSRPRPELFGFSNNIIPIKTYDDMAQRALGMGTNLVGVFEHSQGFSSVIITDENWPSKPRFVKVPANVTILTVKQVK